MRIGIIRKSVQGQRRIPSRAVIGAEGLPARPLAVACATGMRAASAAAWLRRAGHEARRVAGGGIADLAGMGVALAGAR